MKRGLLGLQNQKGFSLTEIMVGGAILAGVGLAGARMFKDQKLAQSRIEIENDLVVAHNTIVKLLHNANNCNATMNAYAGRTGASAWPDASGISTCNNCTSTAVNYTAASVASIDSYVPLNGWVGPSNRPWWQVTRIQVGRSHDNISAGPTGTGKAVMRITYKLKPTIQPDGGKTVMKDINLNLRFTQGASPTFQECISGNESAANNLQHDICQGMTQINSSGGMVMTWDDTTQSCKPAGGVGALALKTCPAGTIIEGVRSDGSVHCKAIGSGVNANEDLMLSSPCAPGSSVKLEIVDGKVKTTCL